MMQDNTVDVPRIKFRLPRLGCFTLFFSCLFAVILLLTLFLRSVSTTPEEFEMPSDDVAVYDPCGVLQESDFETLTLLADEISEAADCSVAVMFVNEELSDFRQLFDSVLAEWAPTKGVLLMYGLKADRIRMALVGGEWILAGHNKENLRKALLRYSLACKAEAAYILLSDLKRSIEQAQFFDQDGSVETDFSGVYYDSELSSSENQIKHSMGVAMLGLGIISLIVGLLMWMMGRSKRRKLLERSPRILAEYEERLPNEPELKLRDMNEPGKQLKPLSFFHHPVMKILAIALGLFFGLIFFLIGANSPPTPDGETIEDAVNYSLPDEPSDAIVDLADAFSSGEERALSETIRQFEDATGCKIRVLVEKSLDGKPLESYTFEVATSWKIGQAGKDNGILLFLAIDDRKNRIEVGYGLEGVLNDARCGDLLRDAVPELREERYADACGKIIRGMEKFLVENATTIEEEIAERSTPLIIAPMIELPDPDWDPRQKDLLGAFFGFIGLLLTLFGILLGFFGRILGTSVPDYLIIDPKLYRRDNDGDTSSNDYDGSSGYDSSDSGSDSDGGGDFGGGGASGDW